MKNFSPSICVVFKVFVLVIFLSIFAPAYAKAAITMDELLEFIQENYGDILSGENTFSTLQRELLAKATPDEQYTKENGEVVPKVNQAYVWCLAKSGDDIWFGTAPNVLCLGLGSYFGITSPCETQSWACRFDGESPNGDWRPPHIYVYNTKTKTLIDKTPVDPRIMQTLGIRSAGTLGNILLLAGPGSNGINLFAFNTETGAYLGSAQLEDYTNIRKWIVANGVLYTAVGSSGGGGKVLRWAGSTKDLFVFEEVGNFLDGSGAELAFHEGRLFVSTWPNVLAGNSLPSYAGLYMSDVIPPGGLTGEHNDSWQKVWQATDYEPDPVTAATYGGGALASFDGYLYWGTMHVPFISAMIHFRQYPYSPMKNPKAARMAILGTHRAISIFRGRNFANGDKKIDLLYGLPKLPVFTPGDDPSPGTWELSDNNMGGALPLWGPPGFGNFFNNYTWSMSVYKNQLFVGTMDWSYLLIDSLEIIAGSIGFTALPDINPDALFNLTNHFFGADLFRFPSSDSFAVPEDINGVGNYTNYGIRNMISDSKALYLGMANPMNLLTDTTDDLPEGGWELIKLTEVPPAAAQQTNGDSDGRRHSRFCRDWTESE